MENQDTEKYLFCDQLLNHLCFNRYGLFSCTVGNNLRANKNQEIIEPYNGEILDLEKFFDERDEMKKNAKDGKLPDTCTDCHFLRSENWDNFNKERKIDYILISNFQRCNSRCIYCISRKDYNPKTDKEPETYNIVPVVKDMIDKGYVTPNTNFDFAGGESTLYENFEELLNLLISSGIKNIIIHSNAIIFSKAIENGIRQGVVSLCVSTDSATRRMHEKVKGVKTYNTVWKNIKKYSKAKPKNAQNSVSVKYIVVKGVNDKKEEIEKWIKKAKSYKIEKIRFNADNDFFIHDQKDLNYNHPYLAYLVTLCEFAVQKAKEYNIKCYPDYNMHAAYKMLGIKLPD